MKWVKDKCKREQKEWHGPLKLSPVIHDHLFKKKKKVQDWLSVVNHRRKNGAWVLPWIFLSAWPKHWFLWLERRCIKACWLNKLKNNIQAMIWIWHIFTLTFCFSFQMPFFFPHRKTCPVHISIVLAFTANHHSESFYL